jgi:hypothetical protein
VAPPPMCHPMTRLQHNICEPKTYSDGTIRYFNLAAITSEPASVQDDLSD